MSNVKQLRAAAMRAHKLAGDKARRVEKRTGAKVAGSEFDPRRDLSKVSRYNSRQLSAYLSELDRFRNRNVQFVAGAGGAPLPQHRWTRYENLQARYNEKAGTAFGDIAGVKLPGGETIESREDNLKPSKRRMNARAANRPLGEINLNANQIASVSALDKLEGRLMGRLSDASQRRMVGAQRFNMGEMFDAIGEPGLVEVFSDLTDKQFSTLWNYTDFADFLSTRYEAVKKMSLTEQAKTGEDIREDILEQYRWAKKIK